jgi:hypothetical protein
MTKDIDDLMDDLEEKAKEVALPHNIEDLEKEIIRLRKTLESYGITQEMHITNVEYICQKAIDDMKKLAMNGGITSDDAKILDILHKNLRMARGNIAKKEAPGKAASEADLLRIVSGSKETD